MFIIQYYVVPHTHTHTTKRKHAHEMTAIKQFVKNLINRKISLQLNEEETSKKQKCHNKNKECAGCANNNINQAWATAHESSLTQALFNSTHTHTHTCSYVHMCTYVCVFTVTCASVSAESLVAPHVRQQLLMLNYKRILLQKRTHTHIYIHTHSMCIPVSRSCLESGCCRCCSDSSIGAHNSCAN